MPGAPIRLVITSPHEIVAHGLRSMLADQSQRVVVIDAEPAEAAADGGVDVVLHDGIAGADAQVLSQLAQRTGAAVLVLADLGPDGLETRQPLVPGAAGWVSLRARSEEIVDLVEAAAAGSLVAELSTEQADGLKLSAREADVLALIAGGLTNQEIADRMFISINSVKTYIRTSYRKIGVSSRSRAVAWCIQHGVRPGSARL